MPNKKTPKDKEIKGQINPNRQSSYYYADVQFVRKLGSNDQIFNRLEIVRARNILQAFNSVTHALKEGETVVNIRKL